MSSRSLQNLRSQSFESICCCEGDDSREIKQSALKFKYRDQGLLVNPTAAITNSSLACSRLSVEGRKESEREKKRARIGGRALEHLCSCYCDLTKGQRQSL